MTQVLISCHLATFYLTIHTLSKSDPKHKLIMFVKISNSIHKSRDWPQFTESAIWGVLLLLCILALAIVANSWKISLATAIPAVCLHTIINSFRKWLNNSKGLGLYLISELLITCITQAIKKRWYQIAIRLTFLHSQCLLSKCTYVWHTVTFFLILLSTIMSKLKFFEGISMLLFESSLSTFLNKLIRTLLIDPLHANTQVTATIISGKISKRSVTCIVKFDSVKSMSSNTVVNIKRSRSIASKMLRILEL